MSFNFLMINWRKISATLLARLILLGIFFLGPWGTTEPTEAGYLRGYTYLSSS